MRCPGFELVLLGIAFLAHGAESENSDFSRNPDLSTIQIVQLTPDKLFRTKPYLLILSLVPVQSTNNATFESKFGGPSRLPEVSEKQKEIVWTAKATCIDAFGGCRTSLLPLLRLETKGERLEIKPRRHSLSINWRKTFY